jgi:hypothetical protein
MSCQLTAHIPFTSVQVVNGTSVVQATIGHIVPKGTYAQVVIQEEHRGMAWILFVV